MGVADDRARYKAVYGMAFDIAKKYYSHYPLPRAYGFFAEVQKSLTEANKADSQYPFKFAQEMMNTVCKWFLNCYDGLSKDELAAIFNGAWAFHKKYIGVKLDDKTWDTILEKSNDAAKEVPKCASGILVAILHELDRQNTQQTEQKEGEQSKDETVS